MAERRLRNRRLSNRRSSNVSGFLNENTNIIDTNDPLWYDRSIVRPSTSVNLTQNQSSVLNSDSTVNASQYSEAWFNNLTKSDVSDVSTVVNNNRNIVDKDSSSHKDPSTETDSESQRKRAQFGLNRKSINKKNRRLRSNAFLQALEKTSNSNNLNVEELPDGEQSESTNDESRTIKKIRPIFKRKKLLKSSESNFDNIFENDKSTEINNFNLSNSTGILMNTSKNNASLTERNLKKLQKSKSGINLNESKNSTKSTKSKNEDNAKEVINSSKNLRRSRSRITVNETKISTRSVKSKVIENNVEEITNSLKNIQESKSRATVNESSSSTPSIKTKINENNLEQVQNLPESVHESKSSTKSAKSKNEDNAEEVINSPKHLQRSRSRITVNETNILIRSAKSEINHNNVEEVTNSSNNLEGNKSGVTVNESNSSTKSIKSKINENQLDKAQDFPRRVQKNKSRINLSESNISTRSGKSNLEQGQDTSKRIQKSTSKIILNESSISKKSVKSMVNEDNELRSQDAELADQPHSKIHNPKNPMLKNAQESPIRIQLSVPTLDQDRPQISNRSAKTTIKENDINDEMLDKHNADKFTFNNLINPKVFIEKESIKRKEISSLKNLEKNNIGKINSLEKLNAEKSNLCEESEKSVETSSDGTLEEKSNNSLNTRKNNVTLRRDQNHQTLQSTNKLLSKALNTRRISIMSDYLLQTPKPAQSTMNSNGRPLMNITGLSFSSTTTTSPDTQNRLRETSIKNQSNKENIEGGEDVVMVDNSDANLDNIPDEVDNSVLQNSEKTVSHTRFQKSIGQIEYLQSSIPNAVWENLKKKTDAIKAQTRVRMAREAAKEKEMKLHKLQHEENLRRILAKQEVLKKQKTKKTVNNAYFVNGKPYKPPKLPRPTKWASDRLYGYLWKCMESRYGIRTRIKSEEFVVKLAEYVKFITNKKKYNQYENELKQLLHTMAKLNIIETPNDFNRFCSDFLPYKFRKKVVPMTFPGNERNIPFYPDLVFKPILNKKNDNSVNTSQKQKNNLSINHSDSEYDCFDSCSSEAENN